MASSNPEEDGYVSAEDEDFVLDAAQAAADDALDAAESGGLAPAGSDEDDIPADATFYQRRAARRKKYDRKMKELQNLAAAALKEISPVWERLRAAHAAESASLQLQQLPWQAIDNKERKSIPPSVEAILKSSFGPSAHANQRKRPRADTAVRTVRE